MFRRRRKLDRSTADILDAYRRHQQYDTHTVKAPTRAPGLVSDYLVPVAHAMTWGVIIACILWTVAILKDWDVPLTALWFLTFLITAALTYLIGTVAVWSLLWAAFETLTNRDLDRSGRIGDRPIIKGRRQQSPRGISGKVNQRVREEPEEGEEAGPELLTVREVGLRYPFVAGENTFQWFVRVAAEIGTVGRQWEPLLGRKRYMNYRDALIDAGWARWTHYDDDGKPIKKTGWVLDAEVDKICREISNL